MAKSVIVVDDEHVLVGAMGDCLGRYGYAVNVKSSGEEALKIVDREPPDIVVLDYRLPVTVGPATCASSVT
jgi:DNA-binding response OmpR family regulator